MNLLSQYPFEIVESSATRLQDASLPPREPREENTVTFCGLKGKAC